MRRRYVYRRPVWAVLARWCGFFCALYLVLAGVEWAVETAPYVVLGALVVAVLGLTARAVR